MTASKIVSRKAKGSITTLKTTTHNKKSEKIEKTQSSFKELLSYFLSPIKNLFTKNGVYNLFKSIKPWFIPFMIVIFLLLGNTLFMFYNDPFYYNQYEKQNIYSIVDEDTARYATDNMLDYLTFQTPELNDFFSDKEKLHLKDVRNLVLIGEILLVLMLVAFVLWNIKLHKKLKCKPYEKVFFNWMIRQGLLMSGFLVVAFLLRGMFGFFFILMHKILFRNDLWLLDPNVDKLILLLPNQFFINVTAVIVIRSFVISIVLMVVGYWLKKRRIE